ncbi:prepilin-type N-terminal cleavage/methylation domain-containing protein [Vibrio hepatarius]|uniref:type IV pilus modification PilV family protein n=1 Tax=Vibrio hepatarius TaxID=171383 RepID=UPI003735B85D
MSNNRGFTLIESVIVIIVMGLAMITITNFLVPQISRSADPHYQTRAAALGQSVMSLILARGFDQQSDFSGGEIRCSSMDTGSLPCSGTAGSALILGPDGETIPNYNDVDDFIGCWEPSPNAGSTCQDLNTLLNDPDGSYLNFRLDIAVNYHNVPDLKIITLQLSAGQQQPLTFTAFRGNY